MSPELVVRSVAETPDLTVYGASARSLDVIASSSMSLVCGIGSVENDRQVLVPFIQLGLLTPELGDADDDGAELDSVYDANLTFENVAYLIMDLARDFKGATRNLSRFAEGSLQPEAHRLSYATECLRQARNQLDETVAMLDGLAEKTPAPSAEPKAKRKAETGEVVEKERAIMRSRKKAS